MEKCLEVNNSKLFWMFVYITDKNIEKNISYTASENICILRRKIHIEGTTFLQRIVQINYVLQLLHIGANLKCQVDKIRDTCFKTWRQSV